ncbi:MAG: acyl-CoA dehydrogenase family protein [Candidatus Binatia bacterium]
MSLRTGIIRRIPAAYYTDERQAILESAREFAMKEVLPIANRLDPEKGEIPMELRDKMAELGYFGILIPPEYGGLGLGIFEYVLVTEELSRAWMSVASIIARGNGLGGGFSEKHRKEMLPKMARGECLGAFALSEPDAGSDAASIRCRAELQGDQWVINGQKMWCTFADGADFIVLVARATPYDPQKRHAGISQFLIPKKRGELPPGVEGTPMRKIGYHGWKTWELSFTDFKIPRENVLGAEQGGSGAGEGFKRALSWLSIARIHTAARAIGLARGALEDSVAYAQSREQFGRPIGDFQAIRFKIATMATEIEAARDLTYAAADESDKGHVDDIKASMAKLFASEMAERVTSEGIQIHGGAGYTTEYPLERYWRDARLTKIFEGTSEIQQRIISDTYLPRAAK